MERIKIIEKGVMIENKVEVEDTNHTEFLKYTSFCVNGSQVKSSAKSDKSN